MEYLNGGCCIVEGESVSRWIPSKPAISVCIDIGINSYTPTVILAHTAKRDHHHTPSPFFLHDRNAVIVCATILQAAA